MEVDPENSWWQGGFPELEKATDNQRYYLQRRMHIVDELLSLEEKTALRIRGGFKEWLDLVSKERATEIIGRIKSIEDQSRLQSVADGIAREHGFNPSSKDLCPLCGGEIEIGEFCRKCKRCGETSIHVRL